MPIPSLNNRAGVWLANPAELLTIDFSNGSSVRKAVHILDPEVDCTSCGWLKLGEVDLTFHFTFDHAQAAEQAVKQLRAKIAETQAKAHRECMVMQEGINKLLAISYSAPAPAPEHDSEDRSWRDTADTIITGCGLLFCETQYWGDLWQDTETGNFVFNGIADGSGGALPDETTWLEDPMFLEVKRDAEGEVIRHGRVFFIPATAADLSPAAQDYIASAPRR